VAHFNDFFKITSKRLQKLYVATTGNAMGIINKGNWNFEGKHELPQNHFNNTSNASYNFNNTSNNSLENQNISAIKNIEAKYSKLQNDLDKVLQTNRDLEKSKSSFEEQSKKYALLYKDELNEKKELLGKYDNLQQQYNHKIEEFSLLRIKLERKLFFLLGLLLVMGLILLLWSFPSVSQLFS